MNFSREKETKEIVVNSNNQEVPQNISKSLLIPYNHQATQTFHNQFLLSSQCFLNKEKGKDLNFSTEKEKKEIVVNSNNYLNSDNIVIFSNENANYGGLENKKIILIMKIKNQT